jgi:ABC transporter transmembrane region
MGAAVTNAGSLMRQHVWPLSLTYLLTITENGVRLLYPFVIGLTIDAMLQGRTGMIGVLLVVWIAHLLIGLTRLVYDTHAFSRVYKDLVLRTVEAQRVNNVKPEVVAARVALSRELVDFFQFGVPALVTALVGLFGSVFMLARYDIVVGVMVLAVLLPITGMYFWFGRRSLRLHYMLNNQLEREISLVLVRPMASVARHLDRLRGWRIRISTGEAITWGIVDICSLVLCTAMLVRLTSQPSMTAGNIYAALAYLFDFSMAVSMLPQALQHAARVRDIWRRLAG